MAPLVDFSVELERPSVDPSVRNCLCGKIGSARFNWDKYTGIYTEEKAISLA